MTARKGNKTICILVISFIAVMFYITPHSKVKMVQCSLEIQLKYCTHRHALGHMPW